MTSVSMEEDGVTAIGESDAGESFRIEARYLVDASGRDTLLGKQLKLKRKSTRHQSAALFAHFSGVERRPGSHSGNISIYRFEHGWAWLIPLQDDITSVGAVCWPDYLKRRNGDPQTFLLDTLRSIPALWQRMTNARVVGHLHATGNYSYECDRMCGPRWIMTGDSFAFVDPIFSSGVYLAMHAAERGAEVVDGALRDRRAERPLQRAFEREIARGLRTLSWFIHRFTSPAMAKLFADPRNHLQIEQAMISMLAGDVFRNNGVLWRLRLFKVLYGITALGGLGAQLRAYWFRRGQVRADFKGGTTSQDAA